MSVLVVGGGISGVAAARTLREAGVDVTLLERAGRLGGRMASPRTDDRVVDTGASYFTVSDPAFDAVVQDWQARGLARPWTDTFRVAHGAELKPKPGPMRWAARAGLRSLVEDLARGLDVQQQRVDQIGPGPTVDGRSADAVVLAMPDPQARRILGPDLDAELAGLDDPFEPVLALTARWPAAAWPAFDGAFVAEDPIVAWIADDGRRRDDFAPVLVAHSTSEFAAEHLHAPEEAAPLLELAVRDVLGIETEASSRRVQRWSFARPTGTRENRYLLSANRIGVCGDAWSPKPRVEAAYLSGVALGRAVAEQLA
ncbi:MAG: NAD(P)/FAD-dependent oxidoreductase [Friedmanniella sp.]